MAFENAGLLSATLFTMQWCCLVLESGSNSFTSRQYHHSQIYCPFYFICRRMVQKWEWEVLRWPAQTPGSTYCRSPPSRWQSSCSSITEKSALLRWGHSKAPIPGHLDLTLQLDLFVFVEVIFALLYDLHASFLARKESYNDLPTMENSNHITTC